MSEAKQITQAEKVAYWTAGYNYWKAKQGVEYPPEYGPPQSYEDAPCAGFYRKAIYEQVPDKQAKRIGWEPVAIWPEGGTLRAVIGHRATDPSAIWTYVCGNSISEDTYRAVAERGEPWPDKPTAQIRDPAR